MQKYIITEESANLVLSVLGELPGKFTYEAITKMKAITPLVEPEIVSEG